MRERAAAKAAPPAPKLQPDDPTVKRLQHYIRRIVSGRPEIWAQIDQMRERRGKELRDWPSWCYMPVAGSYAIVSGGVEIAPEMLSGVGALATLAAWRPTQGIYRYHPDVLAALWETPVDGNIPSEVLHALPEWCVYIETPGRQWHGMEMFGFFAFLESDANDGREELRLMVDSGTELHGLLPVHLGSDLVTGLERAKQETYELMETGGTSTTQPSTSNQPTATQRKSKLSAAGRRAISESQKRRWAARKTAARTTTARKGAQRATQQPHVASAAG
jgi:hypothetical protein